MSRWTNSKDNAGKTPLSIAVQCGYDMLVRLLLARGDIEVNSKDSSGCTPLSNAAGWGHDVVVKLLLARHDLRDGFKGTIWEGHRCREPRSMDVT